MAIRIVKKNKVTGHESSFAVAGMDWDTALWSIAASKFGKTDLDSRTQIASELIAGFRLETNFSIYERAKG